MVAAQAIVSQEVLLWDVADNQQERYQCEQIRIHEHATIKWN